MPSNCFEEDEVEEATEKKDKKSKKNTQLNCHWEIEFSSLFLNTDFKG